MWCTHCQKDCPTTEEDGKIWCDFCGRVICDSFFTEDPSFVKGPGGESHLSGNFVRSIATDFSDSFRRTLDKGKDEIRHIARSLEMDDAIINPSFSFYRMAVERNFTRGRRTIQVAAACIYIACRTAEPPQPYLLIDFSEALSINVYVVGATFLQLCQLLSLGEHNIIKRPIDPTLFIPRFTDKLLGRKNVEVSRTAMRIIASMKRDWMQTGRKPSGLCGAALYISALAHGHHLSKLDIVKIVHICEVTLRKRLIEFENTDSGSLTIEELNNNATELTNCNLSSTVTQKSGELLCQHKDNKEPPPPFAHGLCKSCFKDFMEISGGLNGGSDPPAFQHAERMRVANASAKKLDDSEVGLQLGEKTSELVDKTSKNVESSTGCSQNANKKEKLETTGFDNGKSFDGASDTSSKFKDTSNLITSDESDGLSDIDDVEVSGYLNNEEEIRYKKTIWEEINRQYLEEQAAKINNGEGDKVSKQRKERRQKQDSNANPQTAAEAARQMLSKKRLLSKVNLDMLEKVFDEVTPSNKAPKLSDDDDTNGRSPNYKEHTSDVEDNNDETGLDYQDAEEGYGNGIHDWPMKDDNYEFDYDNDNKF
ncbi:Transcription factor IIIB subunit [Trema orientale]|uniref:Transcription factor IIIB subunit n=1 Tax=Trema orientale TaxID=63057 RepID=A0A2P5BEA7_TREOI|nr:Transcription factor IIIB subunit [Trema orientale]